MGKPFVCDTIAFIHLETDTYKKIEISKKIEIYKIAGWGPIIINFNVFKKPSKSMETKYFYKKLLYFH